MTTLLPHKLSLSNIGGLAMGPKIDRPCKYFAQGSCRAGTSCNYNHPRSSFTGKPCRNGSSCRWFSRDKCHFIHSEGIQQSNQSIRQKARTGMCWSGKECKRINCRFVHFSSTEDFPLLGKPMKPNVWIPNNGKYFH